MTQESSPTMAATREEAIRQSSLALLQGQRSHVLFVFSNCDAGREPEFREWYQASYAKDVSTIGSVLRIQNYEQHDVDVTGGHYAPPPFKFLCLCEISVDGAEKATDLVEEISRMHREQPSALPPATWLYYPLSEKVGRPPTAHPSMITLAFANAVTGQDAEFREWYVTRHIRHALNIPALTSGQCFERALFQQAGSLAPDYGMIALYEQDGGPEDIIESIRSLPRETFAFPAMDSVRFAEWVYRPLPPS